MKIILSILLLCGFVALAKPMKVLVTPLPSTARMDNGLTYALQSCEDLSKGEWVTITNVKNGTYRCLIVDMPKQVFFRVVTNKPAVREG